MLSLLDSHIGYAGIPCVEQALDFGCRDTQVTTELSYRAKTVIAFEIFHAPVMNYASSNILPHNGNRDLFLSFSKNRFDLIVFDGILERFEESKLPRLISNLSRSLAPNGLLFFKARPLPKERTLDFYRDLFLPLRIKNLAPTIFAARSPS